MSKRKLLELVEGQATSTAGTIRACRRWSALRRRGYTPEAIRLFAERIGVSKADISGSTSACSRTACASDLNERAPRAHRGARSAQAGDRQLPGGRAKRIASRRTTRRSRSSGKRALPFARELWIERDDFSEQPPKGYFRLSPGAEVRLRYGYIIKCVGADKDAAGNVVAVHCTYDPDTRSGTPGAEARKVKGNIHWLSVPHAQPR